jgi:hypothetical protein
MPRCDHLIVAGLVSCEVKMNNALHVEFYTDAGGILWTTSDLPFLPRVGETVVHWLDSKATPFLVRHIEHIEREAGDGIDGNTVSLAMCPVSARWIVRLLIEKVG